MTLPGKPIRVSVVGGFLGAGKTTLVNHLLSQPDAGRVTVMVNDFGSINIDAALIDARDAQTIRLTNGCVCCQIGGDLTDALIGVIESAHPPDAIVIEASGVSDPWRIAEVGRADRALALESVIVMVDAASFPRLVADPLLADTLLRQVRSADVLVINKCDLVDATQLNDLRQSLGRVAPRTPSIDTVGGALPWALLDVFEPKDTLRRVSPSSTRNGLHPLDDPSRPQHGDLFAHWSMKDENLFSEAGLRRLLDAMPDGVLRLKGILATASGLVEIHYSGWRGSLRQVRHAIPDDVRGVVVAIGLRESFTPAELRSALQRARCEQGAPQDFAETLGPGISAD